MKCLRCREDKEPEFKGQRVCRKCSYANAKNKDGSPKHRSGRTRQSRVRGEQS